MTKRINPLPSKVDKDCGTKPGEDDEQRPMRDDGELCGNPAAYAVPDPEGEGELLVCGTHRLSLHSEYPDGIPEGGEP